jgi:4-hydroxyphenylpyruvate dioxygenase
MPDRSPVKGVAFVEFSASEADAAAVTGILRTLGFRTTAQHRSKKVSVFFQGNIRLLLNTQEPGFASASYTIRGTSAYAMAMTVDDAHDALDRAAALGAEIFSQPVDAGAAPSRPFAAWAEG